jgi:GMC oxidoreductase
LLNAQRTQPTLFGGKDGALGRYYMGHIFGQIAYLVLANSADADLMDAYRDVTGTYVRRRFSISTGAQIGNELLNVIFHADNPPFHAAETRSGLLSLVFLALSVPAIGRRLVAEGIRRVHVGDPPYNYRAHLKNVICAPWSTLTQIIAIIRDRYLSATRRPAFLVRNSSNRYGLYYHGENIPRENSRVCLAASDQIADFPQLEIDLLYGDEEIDAVLRAHGLLDGSLRASGKGHLEYRVPVEDLAKKIREQASDGFHQIGGCRMGDDSKRSVVDKDCRVHGLSNLFVASSSVFPTSGQANPTFTAISLGIRLAHYIAELSRNAL